MLQLTTPGNVTLHQLGFIAWFVFVIGSFGSAYTTTDAFQQILLSYHPRTIINSIDNNNRYRPTSRSITHDELNININDYRTCCYKRQDGLHNNNVYQHRIQRRLSFSKLFSSTDSSSSLPENDGSDGSRDDRYESNKLANQRWLIDRFKFPKKRLYEQSHHYSFLTLENSILEGRVDWVQQKLNLTDKETGKIIKGYPWIIQMRPDTNLGPTLDCLESSLRLDAISLKKLVLKDAGIVRARKEDFDSKLLWYQQRLDLTGAQVGKMAMKFPSFLTYSINDKVEPNLKWIKERLDLNDAEVSKIVQKQPQIACSFTPSTMESKLQWVQQRLSLADDRLSAIIMRQPQILMLDTESNLGPTLDFYIDAIGKDAAIAMLSRNPVYLCFSLKNKLIPRLAQAKEAGLDIDEACIRRIGKLSKEKWDIDLEERL